MRGKNEEEEEEDPQITKVQSAPASNRLPPPLQVQYPHSIHHSNLTHSNPAVSL